MRRLSSKARPTIIPNPINKIFEKNCHLNKDTISPLETMAIFVNAMIRKSKMAAVPSQRRWLLFVTTGFDFIDLGIIANNGIF